MTERKRLTITDMMIGVLLMAAVALAVKEPRLLTSPDTPRKDLAYVVRQGYPFYWLGPTVVLISGTILLAVSIGARLSGGARRTFLAGMALGGWLWYWLAFGTGDPEPLSSYFLPISWVDTLAIWARWFKQDHPRLMAGISWELFSYVQYAFESVACLMFGALCGYVAVGLSRSANDHSRLYALVRRIVFSIWPWVGAAIVASTLCGGKWETPDEVISPPVTAAFLLFGLAAMMSWFGPTVDRLAYSAFAIVGVGYLAVAFGPWSVGLREWLPGRWIVERLAHRFFALESEAAPFARGRDVAIAAFTLLGQVLFAWFLALLATKVALLVRSYASKTTPVSTAPKGEPCPS
jgi:hypothetical protein